MRKKISFNDNIEAKSGRGILEKRLVFVTKKGKKFSYQRAYFIPRRVPCQEFASLKFKAAMQLWQTAKTNTGFISDLKDYTRYYNNDYSDELKSDLIAINLFIGAICRHSSVIANKLEDLAIALGENVNEWINNGYLKKVSVSNAWDNSLV
jgi:hypothetical protein